MDQYLVQGESSNTPRLASCYRKRYKLWPCGSWLMCAFTFLHIFACERGFTQQRVSANWTSNTSLCLQLHVEGYYFFISLRRNDKQQQIIQHQYFSQTVQQVFLQPNNSIMETLALQALFLFKPALSEICYLFSVSIMSSVQGSVLERA